MSAVGVGGGEAAAALRFVAIAPRGLSDLLAQELQALGAADVTARSTGVRFQGSLETGYRACLWSRVASRVLLVLEEFAAQDAEAFYRQAGRLDWRAHVDPHGTLACDFSGSLAGIDNSHFGALRLKDAVCDRLREQCGVRPDVQLQRPSVRLHAHAHAGRVTLALDLAGEGLHRRGYRREAGEAPLRENLAAGVLLRAGWAQAAARGAPFLDPMCGSGTLVIEAAMIAAQRAPGLLRDYFGFLGWRGHDAALWQGLYSEARERALAQVPSRIRGTDRDGRAVAVAITNAQRAGVAALVRFEQCGVGEVREAGAQGGLICTNPPYGERLGDEAAARRAHAELGRVLREHFAGWEAAILTAAPGAARELQLRSYRVHELWNGPIACRLLRIDLAAPGQAAGPGSAGAGAGAGVAAAAAVATAAAAAAAESPGAQMLANRLRKNLQHLGRQARREHVSCYRLYDADMPEYAFAIDRYEAVDGGAVHLHVQEYAPPASIDLQAARRRRREMLGTLPQALEVPPERIHLRVRRRQRGAQQYQPRRTGAGRGAGYGGGYGAGRPFLVEEAGLKFLVNLDDYLDTGLFLDHRPTRALLRERARGVRFLNLFCYTATATVFAAAGGARESLSIDLSNHYLQWAAENFRVNGLDGAQHRLERADCLEWLRESAADDAAAGTTAAVTALPGRAAAGHGAARSRLRFELIFLDPPTFSNSKRMRGVLDVQRDHPELLERCMQLLVPGGQLIFSTNARRFKLAASIPERWQVIDLSRATLPFDFVRNPRIHSCFELRHRT